MSFKSIELELNETKLPTVITKIIMTYLVPLKHLKRLITKIGTIHVIDNIVYNVYDKNDARCYELLFDSDNIEHSQILYGKCYEDVLSFKYNIVISGAQYMYLHGMRILVNVISGRSVNILINNKDICEYYQNNVRGLRLKYPRVVSFCLYEHLLYVGMNESETTMRVYRFNLHTKRFIFIKTMVRGTMFVNKKNIYVTKTKNIIHQCVLDNERKPIYSFEHGFNCIYGITEKFVYGMNHPKYILETASLRYPKETYSINNNKHDQLCIGNNILCVIKKDSGDNIIDVYKIT